jgi:hypothetical protein
MLRNVPGLSAQFAEINVAYSKILIIISPPRSGSTALSRVFWEQPSIRYYAHEPFEIVFYEQRPVKEVLAKLKQPIDLGPLKRNPGPETEKGLVIKEMPYQVGDYFAHLVSLTHKPVTFLIRDPRQSISSRMRKKIEVGQSPVFPNIETGWTLLAAQIEHCRKYTIPFTIVDSGEFRRYPETIFKRLFSRLGLPFFPGMLKWKALPNFDLDNLDGHHTHLYQTVLGSKGVTKDSDPIPGLEYFPEKNGFRRHVLDCLEIYHRLRELPELIRMPAG